MGSQRIYVLFLCLLLFDLCVGLIVEGLKKGWKGHRGSFWLFVDQSSKVLFSCGACWGSFDWLSVERSPRLCGVWIDIGCVAFMFGYLRLGAGVEFLELLTSCSNDLNPCLCVVWMSLGFWEGKRNVTRLVPWLPLWPVCTRRTKRLLLLLILNTLISADELHSRDGQEV